MQRYFLFIGFIVIFAGFTRRYGMLLSEKGIRKLEKAWGRDKTQYMVVVLGLIIFVFGMF